MVLIVLNFECSVPDSSDQLPCSDDTKVPAMSTKTRKYYFQQSWLQEFKWTVLEDGKVFCTVCRKASDLKIFTSAVTVQEAFISVGFNNWKKGASKLAKHEQSDQHRVAVQNLHKSTSTPVNSQVLQQKARSQLRARTALKTMITSLLFLGKQGLALRGHNKDDGNYLRLLTLRSVDVQELHEWLQRSKPLTASDVQNEIIGLLARHVLQALLEKVKLAEHFSIIVDETSDTSGKEQLPFCVRIVNDDLEPEEPFLGLYEVASTTADTLKAVVTDILNHVRPRTEELKRAML